MSDAESLELRLRVVAQGQENLKQINDALKSMTAGVAGVSGALDGFNKKLGAFEVAERQIKSLNSTLGSFGGGFASRVNQAISNPLLAVGTLAENLITKLGPLGSAFATVGATIVGIGAAAVTMANSLAQSAREITNFAARTGLSVQGVQQFQAASKIAGVNANALETGIRTLSSALADHGAENQRASKALQSLGVNAYAVSGQLRPMDQILDQIFRSLGAITNPADRVRLAVETLGRSAGELIPLSGNLDKLKDAVEQTGVVMSGIAIDSANRYAQSMAKLGLQFDAVINKMKSFAVESLSVLPFFNDLDELQARGTNRVFPNQTAGGQPIDGRNRIGQNIRQTQDINGNIISPDAFAAAHGNAARTFQPFGISNSLTFDSPAVRDRNRKQADALIAQFDPESQLKAAQASLADALSTVQDAQSHGSFVPADARSKLSRARAGVDSAKEAIEFPKQLAELQKQLNQATDQQLSPLQKINAEYAQSIEALKQIKGLSAGKRDALTNVLTGTRSARSGQAVVSAGQAFQVQQAQLADLQDRLGLSTRQRQAEQAARLAIATGRIDPNSSLGIQQAFGIRTSTNAENHAAELAGIARDRGNLDVFTGSERKQREREADDRQARETARFEEENDKAKSDREVALADLKRRDAAEQAADQRKIVDIGNQLTKSLTSQAFEHAGILQGLDPTKSPTQQAQQALAQRLAAAQSAADIDYQNIARNQSADKQRIAAAEILKSLTEERGAAELDFQRSIADLQKKRIEETQQTAHSLASALLTPGGTQSFIREQSRGFATTVLGNALTPFVGSVSDSASKLFPAGGPLGNLFKGTAFQSHDEQGVSLSSNTKSTIDNTAATAALAKIMVDVANGRTPQAPNLPGVPALSGITSTAANGPTNGTLQNILAPLIGAGVGASLGHSLADTFLPPTLQNITANKRTFDPKYQLTHPLATLAGGVVGGGLGLLSDATRHSSAVAVPGSSGVTQLVPIQQQALEALQQIYGAIANGGSGLQGLPVNVQGLGGVNLPDLPGSGVAALSNPLAAFNIGGLFGPNPAGSAFSSSGGDSLLDSLPLSSRIDPGTMSALTLGAAATPSSITSSLQSFSKSLGIVPGGGGAPALYDAISGADSYKDAQGNSVDFTGASRAGAIAGGAASIAAGAISAYQGFSKGGAKGALSGTSSVLGLASALDPEPVSRGILAIAALGTSLVGSLLGDPKQLRAQQEATALSQETYLAPPTINKVVDVSGRNVQYDSQGHPYSTTSTGVNITPNQSYFFNGQYSNVPGYSNPNLSSPAAVSPSQATPPPMYATPGNSTTVHLTVNALDSQSILNRSADIGAAVYEELGKSGSLKQRVQSSILGS